MSPLETTCQSQASLLCSHKPRHLYSTRHLLEDFWGKICDMITCPRHSVKGRKPGEGDSRQAPYTTRFVAGAAGICVWSAEIQLCHYFWFTQLMAWVAPFRSTCSGRCVTSQGQHEGYTSCKYHTLSDLGSTFRSLVVTSTPNQTGKNSSTEEGWTPVELHCVTPQFYGLNCPIPAPEDGRWSSPSQESYKQKLMHTNVEVFLLQLSVRISLTI